MSRSRPTSWGSRFTSTSPATSYIPWDELEPIPGLIYSNTEPQEDRRPPIWYSNSSSVGDSTAAGPSQAHQQTGTDIRQLYRGSSHQNFQRPESAPTSADVHTAIREVRRVRANACNTTSVRDRRRDGSRTRLHSTPTPRRGASPAPRMMDPGRSTLASTVVSQATSEPADRRPSATVRATPVWVTQPMDIPVNGSSRRVSWYDSHSVYDSDPDASSDPDAYSDFEDCTTTEELMSDLTLDVVSDPLDLEKWDVPPGISFDGFLGNGWKLKLIVSYTSANPTGNFDIEFEPLIAIKVLAITCTLATVPRQISATTQRFRNYLPPFTVAHHGAERTSDRNGHYQEMDPKQGIYKDPYWRGPMVVGNHYHKRRMEYSTNVYVPIPISLFKATDTRAFDIEVRVCVFAANLLPVELKKLQRLHFSNFVQIVELDDSKRCALVG